MFFIIKQHRQSFFTYFSSVNIETISTFENCQAQQTVPSSSVRIADNCFRSCSTHTQDCFTSTQEVQVMQVLGDVVFGRWDVKLVQNEYMYTYVQQQSRYDNNCNLIVEPTGTARVQKSSLRFAKYNDERPFATRPFPFHTSGPRTSAATHTCFKLIMLVQLYQIKCI